MASLPPRSMSMVGYPFPPAQRCVTCPPMAYSLLATTVCPAPPTTTARPAFSEFGAALPPKSPMSGNQSSRGDSDTVAPIV